MRYFTMFCSLILLTVVDNTSLVKACGGGAPFFVQEFDDRDLIVHATVLDVDDRGYNAILQVDRYFKGDGGEYLAVMRYPPALEVVATIREYDTSCTYSGGGRKWITGNEGYFALSDRGNGTYVDIFSRYRGAPHFFVQDGLVEFYSYDVYTDVEPQLHALPTDEFESMLQEYGDRNETVEPEQNAYPLMRFLNITTESGQQYLLNPDRSLTLLNPETTPLTISNDGSHIVFRLDDNQLGFQYLSLIMKSQEPRGGGWLIPQNGRSALFSPDSNFVAILEEDWLTIFMFDNYEDGGYGQRMTMQEVANTDVAWPTDDSEPTIAWSADSTAIAFQDERGIWLWDIFEDSEPQLVVAYDDEITLLDLSDSGRYLRYDLSDTWFLLDVQDGEIFENAIATPDERTLIYFRSDYPEGPSDINRRGGRECRTPLLRSCPIYISWSQPFDFFWYKHNQIALFGCGEDTCAVVSYHWQLSTGGAGSRSRLNIAIPIVSAFDYDITYDQPVVAINDFTLEFGFYPSYERDEPSDPPPDIDMVDLSDQLDSPIIELEWGQPIFYRLNQ